MLTLLFASLVHMVLDRGQKTIFLHVTTTFPNSSPPTIPFVLDRTLLFKEECVVIIVVLDRILNKLEAFPNPIYHNHQIIQLWCIPFRLLQQEIIEIIVFCKETVCLKLLLFLYFIPSWFCHLCICWLYMVFVSILEGIGMHFFYILVLLQVSVT